MILLFQFDPAPGWEIRTITILFFLFAGVVSLAWIVRRASAQYYKEDADMDALRSFVKMTPKQQEQVKTEIGIHAYLELLAKEQKERKEQEAAPTVRFDPDKQRIEWGDWSLENQRN